MAGILWSWARNFVRVLVGWCEPFRGVPVWRWPAVYVSVVLGGLVDAWQDEVLWATLFCLSLGFLVMLVLNAVWS